MNEIEKAAVSWIHRFGSLVDPFRERRARAHLSSPLVSLLLGRGVGSVGGLGGWAMPATRSQATITGR